MTDHVQCSNAFTGMSTLHCRRNCKLRTLILCYSFCFGEIIQLKFCLKSLLDNETVVGHHCNPLSHNVTVLAQTAQLRTTKLFLHMRL